MNPIRSHIVAATVLTITGLLAGMGAAVIGVASLAVAAGLGARPADALLLDDLLALQSEDSSFRPVRHAAA